MRCVSRSACAALFVSINALMLSSINSSVSAQTVPQVQQQQQQQPLPPISIEAPKRRPKPKPARAGAAQPKPAPAPPVVSHEPTTNVATKTDEPVISTLAPVSVLGQEQINQAQPTRLSDILTGMPGVWAPERGDDPSSAINIRGLQEFGRVAVLVDGAPQDFERSGHFADGTFYVDPEFLAGLDVVRGPVANIYGSGAIGGVASFRTKSVDDILLPGEIAAGEIHGLYGTNGNDWLTSVFAGARGPYADILVGGVYRDNGNYREGNGDVVGNTANTTESGMVKLTDRPGEGQEIKLTAITYNTNYNFGDTTGEEGVYATNVKNQTVTAQYSLKPADVPLLDLQTNVYWNQTLARQTVTVPYVIDGIDFTGPPGTTSSFMVNTTGFDIHNTSRFDTGPFRQTVTYGGDFKNDAADTMNGNDPGAPLTPGGQRNTYGSFLQWKTNYSTWFEMVNAVRYDGFALNGDGVSHSGDRLSPKTTIGITPIPGLQPYVSYAEGYRAPSVTESFIAGFHPGEIFYFMPNPNLAPEVGKTSEAGLNVKYDNVFTADDKFRAKINIFQNNITNYIDLTEVFSAFAPPFPPAPTGCQLSGGGFYYDCYQYVNVPQAMIQGAEFQASYDAGLWFTGLSGQHTRGENKTTGAPLATIPPDQLSFLLGARFLDRKLTLAMRWTAVAAKPLSQIPLEQGDTGLVPIFDPTPSYNLVNLYLGYQPNPDVTAAFSVENLLNVDYTKYMCCSTAAGYVVPSPGITFKASLTVRYGIKDNAPAAKGNDG